MKKETKIHTLGAEVRSSLWARLGIKEDGYPIASRIIRNTIEQGDARRGIIATLFSPAM